MTEERPDLNAAYGLTTPEDSVRLYREWAASYDADFVTAQDYRLPEIVALAFAGRGGNGPVLDVGAGTGEVGQHLARLGVTPVEATDISQEMLDIAARKSVYSELFVGNIVAGLQVEPAYFSGVVSAGTFTLGHLGPDAMDEICRVASHGGLICVSVNSAHFQAAGFEAKLKVLAPYIRDLRIDETRIYGDKADTKYRLDTAKIISFHKA